MVFDQIKILLNSNLIIFVLLELTFLGQWWSKSDCILYISPDDVHKITNEHMLVM
jgi:hypothetical protein